MSGCRDNVLARIRAVAIDKIYHALRNACLFGEASTRFRADSGTSSPDLMTTVLPQTSAGISFHDGIAIGKLNGAIRPQIPTGCLTHIANLLGISAGGREANGDVVPRQLCSRCN